MKKVLIVLGLILLGLMLFQRNSSTFPQFSDSQLQFICIEEGLEWEQKKK